MIHLLINNGALGHCSHHVRYDKLFTVLKFYGASTVGYILIVIWPHSELWRSGLADAVVYGFYDAGFFQWALQAPHSSPVPLPSLFVYRRGFQMVDVSV